MIRRDARPRAMVGVGVASALAVAVFVALLPMSSLLCIAGASASCVAIAAAAARGRDEATILPDDIADPVLRESYREIVSARFGLQRALVAAPGFARSARSLLDRCDAAVRLCGRLAPAANRAHAYLATGDAWRLAQHAAQLRARVAAARDARIASDLEAAAAACERELATRDALERTRDRIQARLDFVLASLRAFTARVTEQQTVEDEQLALAGESPAEHVDSVDQELAAIESALGIDDAAA